jgi:hypothetical protein
MQVADTEPDTLAVQVPNNLNSNTVNLQIWALSTKNNAEHRRKNGKIMRK